MTNEEKQLLIKDLSARLPYGVKLLYNSNSIAKIKDRIEILRGIIIGYTIWFETNYNHSEYDSTSGSYGHFKPYLRPMSSMTEEEINEFILISDTVLWIGNKRSTCILSLEQMDWFNTHHFDYRGLIEKGLALPAPEGMYNFK